MYDCNLPVIVKKIWTYFKFRTTVFFYEYNGCRFQGYGNLAQHYVQNDMLVNDGCVMIHCVRQIKILISGGMNV